MQGCSRFIIGTMMKDESEKSPEEIIVKDGEVELPVKSADTFPRPIPTAWGFRGFVLSGATFVLFELLFLVLYSTTDWFSVDVTFLGIPAVILVLPLAHQFLRSLESPIFIQLAMPLKNGLPFVVYWNWLTLRDTNLTFGARKVAYSVIDELRLTAWGNIHLRTRALRSGHLGELQEDGVDKPEPTELIFRLPLGVVAPKDQKRFVETIKKANPNVLINQRLQKRLSANDVSGSQMVSLLGSIIMLFVLLDLGQSTFTYLEILKAYYRADVDARENKVASATAYLTSGDKLLNESLPISWIKYKVFKEGNAAIGVILARADVLFHLKRTDEAIAECRRALVMNPKAFRINLEIARMLASQDKLDEAIKEIQEAIDIKKTDTFLPRSYMLAVETEKSGNAATQKLFETYLKDFDEEVFRDEPVWPPGGERMIHDVWFRRDLTFVYERLLRMLKRS